MDGNVISVTTEMGGKKSSVRVSVSAIDCIFQGETHTHIWLRGGRELLVNEAANQVNALIGYALQKNQPSKSAKK